MTAPTRFELHGDHIALDALLKATGMAGSGGAAKMLIVDGAVRVNGQAETRRGRKLRAGDEVTLEGACVRLEAAAVAVDAASPTGTAADTAADTADLPA